MESSHIHIPLSPHEPEHMHSHKTVGGSLPDPRKLNKTHKKEKKKKLEVR